MLTRVLIGSLRSARGCMTATLRRNIGITAAVSQKANMDPIQKMFVDKIHDYAKKSKASSGKLVEASPEFEKQMTDELTKLEKMYNATGKDMTKFPEFNFQDPALEAVDLGLSQEDALAHVQASQKSVADDTASEEGKQDIADVPYFSQY